MHLEIELHSSWHVSSGYGDGPAVDALVVKSREGLPYLPGRTLKGLMRDACRLAEELGHIEKQSTQRLFGGGALSNESSPGTARFSTTQGSLDVRNATLGKTAAEERRWKQWALECPDEALQMFEVLHSTAIDSDGVIKEQSLRSVEFAIPMTLYAELGGPAEDLSLLPRFLPLIRELGSRRRRGFGRCSLRLEEGAR